MIIETENNAMKSQMKKILIVDDEPFLREMLREVFELHDIVVVEAKDGLEALEIFETERPDLVLTDQKMPRMTGGEMINKLKASSDTPPVCILTSSDPTWEVFAERNGIPFFLKPMRLLEIESIADIVKTEGFPLETVQCPYKEKVSLDGTFESDYRIAD